MNAIQRPFLFVASLVVAFEISPVLAQTRLSVPYYHQDHSDWCWATSSSMVLKFYGFNRKPWEIAADLNKKKNGFFWETSGFGGGFLRDYMNQNFNGGDRNPWVMETFSSSAPLKERIVSVLSSGDPLLLMKVGVPFESGAHAIVITGCDQDNVYIHDPSGYFFSDEEHLVNRAASWTQFNQRIDDHWLLPFVGGCDVIYHTGKRTAFGGALSMEFLPTFMLVRNSYGLPQDRVRQLYLDWEGYDNPTGYKFLLYADFGTWYVQDSHLGYKATQADVISLWPNVWNYSVASSSEVASVKVEIRNEDGQVVRTFTSEQRTIPSPDGNQLAAYWDWVPQIELAGLQEGTYGICVKLFRDGVTQDSCVYVLPVAKSDYASFVAQPVSGLHQDVVRGLPVVWKFKITNKGSKVDDIELTTMEQGSRVLAKQRISPGGEGFIEYSVVDTKSLNTGSEKTIEVILRSTNDPFKSTLIPVTMTVVSDANMYGGSISQTSGMPSDPFVFSVYYKSTQTTPLVPAYVKVIVDGVASVMQSDGGGNWSSGVKYSYMSTNSQFAVGQHGYHFEAMAGGTTLLEPASGEYSFEVTKPTAGIMSMSLSAETVNKGSSVTAIVSTNPVKKNYPINFSSSPVNGFFSNNGSTTTDANGSAQVTYFPSDAGDVVIKATDGLDNTNFVSKLLRVTVPTLDLRIDVTHSRTGVTNGVVQYTVNVSVTKNGNAYNSPFVATLRTSFGYWDGSGGPTMVWNKTDNSFQRDFILCATTDGTANITVSIGDLSISNSFPVQFTIPAFGAVRTISAPGIVSISFSPTERKIAYSTSDWRLHIYDIDQDRVIKNLGPYKIPPNSANDMEIYMVKYSPDGRKLFIGGYGSRVIDTAGVPLAERPERWFMSSMDAACWVGTSYIAVGGQTTPYYNAILRSDLSDYKRLDSPYQLESVDANSNEILMSFHTGSEGLSLLYSSSGSRIWPSPFNPPDNERHPAVALSPDGAKAAVFDANNNGIIYLLDNSSGSTLSYWGTGTRFSWQLRWNPIRPSHLAQTLTTGLVIWDVSTGKEAMRTNDNYSGDTQNLGLSNWSGDGQMIAVARPSQGEIQLFAPFDLEPPAITVASPKDGVQTTQSSILMTGSITDDNGVASARYRINSGDWVQLTLNGPQKSFNTSIALQLGQNAVAIEAADVAGRRSTVTLNVVRQVLLPPEAPTLASPADGSSNQPTNLILRWNGASSASSYRLQIAKDVSFQTVVLDDSSVVDWFYQVNSFENGTTYYWRVCSKGPGGTSGYSSAWRFKTIVTAPLAPALALPQNGTVDQAQTVLFAWRSASRASNYLIQVSRDSSFASNIVVDTTLSDTSYTKQNLAAATKHFWRVKSINDGGASAWTAVWNFTTRQLPLSRYVLSVSSSSPIAGSSVTVFAQLVDGTGAPAAIGSKVVAWSSTNGGSFSGSTSTTNSNGLATIVFTASKVAGTVHAVTARDNDSFSGTSANIITTSGPAVNYIVASSSYSPVAGSTVMIVAQLIDVNNNPVSTAGKTVRWSSTNGGTFSSPTSSTDNSGGTAVRFTVSSVAGTVHTVTGTDDSGLTGTSGNIITVPTSATKYLVTSSSYGPVAGSSVTITAQLADASNNPVGNAGKTVMWSSTNGGTFSSATSTTNNFGTASVVFTTSTLVGTIHTVVATDNDNLTGISANITTGVPSMPEVPSLNLPPDSARDMTTTPTLSWLAVLRATTYRLQVASNPAFSPLVFEDSLINTTSRQVGPLANQTTYLWRVRASNAGGTSSWSTVWRFTTQAAGVVVPSPPSLALPMNGSGGISPLATLNWYSSIRATSYRLQVSVDSAFSNVIVDRANITDTSSNVTGLGYEATYWWKVNATNSAGTSAFSMVWKFTTQTAPMVTPYAPSLVSPAKRATGVSLTPTLSWNSSKGATSYHLQLSADSSFSGGVIDKPNLSDTSTSVPTLSYNTLYYWRVNATNSAGTSAYSVVSSFTTQAAPIVTPSAPSLVSPAKGATGVSISPTLSWNASKGATSYHLQLSADSSFSSGVNDKPNLTDTTSSVTGLAYNTLYWWRVSATNSAGTSAYSVVWNFMTQLAPIMAPSAPILASPATGATGVSITPTLSWNGSNGATSYNLQLSADSSFSSGVIDRPNITDTSSNVTVLEYGTPYYWRVSAANAGGTSGWSTVWRFATSTLSGTTILGEYRPDSTTILLLHMNESSGTNVSDASSYGNNGVANGTTVVDGRFGKARSINGGAISARNCSGLGTLSMQVTIETWIAGTTASPWDFSVRMLRVSNPDRYELGINKGYPFVSFGSVSRGINGGSVDGNSMIADGRWHHLAAVRDRDTVQLFVDGCLVNSGVLTNLGSIVLDPFININANMLNCAVDEIRISNIARSPEEFNLQLPPRNLVSTSSLQSVTLAWQNGGGTVPLMRYRIYRGIDSTSVSLIDSTMNTSYYNSGIIPRTRYFYRISAIDSTGFESVKSYAASGVVSPTILPPTLVSPIDGAIEVATNPTPSWNASTGATSYHLQISTSSNFSTTVFDLAGITGTSQQVTGLDYSLLYYWRVSATNSAGTSAYSPPWSFTIITQPTFNNGMSNTYVESLVINSSGYVFAGTFGGGVFRSTDNGGSWTPVNSGLTNMNVNSLAINFAGDVFAGTDDGVCRSTDGGGSWTTVESELTNTHVTSLAINSSGYVFAVGANRVFRSTNNGGSWRAVNSGLETTFVTTLVIDLSGSVLVGTTTGGVFRSTDNGESWTGFNSGLTNMYVISLATNSAGSVFAGTAGGGAFRSTDNGGNWTVVDSGLSSRQTNMYVTSLAINSAGSVFAGTWSGLFQSTDNGVHWIAVDIGLSRSVVVQTIAINANGFVFAGIWGVGVWRSPISFDPSNPVLFVAPSQQTVGSVGGMTTFSVTNTGTGTMSWTAVSDQGWSTIAGGSPGTNSGTITVRCDTNKGVSQRTATITVTAATASNSPVNATIVQGGTTSEPSGKWVRADGPEGGVVSCLVVLGTDLFAGTLGGGVFLSSNNGTSWSCVSDGLTNTTILSLAASGVNIFAGTSGGVFLSTNRGASWTSLNNGLPEESVYSVAVDGTDIFIGIGGMGVFWSTNNGTSWMPISNGLTNGIINSIAIIGQRLYAGTEFAGVFVSTNRGASWTPINTGLTSNFITSIASIGGNLYAGTWGGVFVSTNGGVNWTSLNNGLTNTNIGAIAADGANIFLGTAYGGMFYSTNSGTTWTEVNNGLTNTYVHSLAVVGTNVFAGTNGGAFVSTNRGNSWSAVNTGITNTSAFALTTIGTNLFAGTEHGVFLSSDGGTSWKPTKSELGCVNAFALRGSKIFAGVNPGGVYVSEDGCASWKLVISGLTGTAQTLAVNGTGIFAGTIGGVCLSTDDGQNWMTVNAGLTQKWVNTLIASGSDTYAGTEGGGVFVSTNNGTSWIAVNNGMTNAYIRALAASGTNIFAGSNGGGAFLSTNGGISWISINNGLTNLNVHSFAFDGEKILAGTEDGVFLTTNNGMSWSAANEGLTNADIRSLMISGTRIIAGTLGRGVWRRSLSDLVVLSVPSLSWPLNGTAGVATSATLIWNTSSGATTYRLQVSIDSSFKSLTVDQSGLTITSYPLIGLSNNTTYYWRVSATSAGGTSNYSSVWSFTTVSTYLTVSGTVRYGNVGGSPIRGVNVTLAPLPTGNQMLSATDSSGNYLFTNVLPGSYSLAGNKVGGHPSAYVNAADALRAAKYPMNASAIETLLALAAADVNNDGTINAADALQIMLHYVGTLASFAKGDWIFVPAQSTINVGTTNIIDNIQGIAVGDVNMDALPSSGAFFAKANGATQTVAAIAGPTMIINRVDIFEVPIRVRAAASLGSISLALQYPVDAATFLGVRGPESTVSAAKNGVVAVAWFNAEHPMNLRENDVVVALRFKPSSSIKDFNLTLDPSSQLTDAKGSVLSGVNLEIPTIDASLPTVFALGQNYPNPFNPSTTIRYEMPKAGNVSLKVYNTLGQLLATLVDERKEASYYQATWNASNVPSGIYFYRLQAGEFIDTKKAILLK